MKTYIKNIIVLIILLTTVNVFSQNLPKNFKEKIKKEYKAIKSDIHKGEEFKETFEEYYKYAVETYRSEYNFLKKIAMQKSVSNLCANGTFENGEINVTDWNFFWDGYGPSGTTRINTGAFGGGFPDCHGTHNSVLPPKQVHHKVVTSGMDPYFNQLNRVSSFPTSNSYSLRLGNDYAGKGTESIAKKIMVTPANSLFSFSYAVVMANAHPISSQPYFKVEVIEANNLNVNHNNLVDLGGGSNKLVSSHPLLDNNNASTNGIVYKDWACVTVDLSSLVGTEVIIKFKTRDCSATCHWSYAYIDNVCLECSGNSDEGSIKLGEKSDCDLPGKICIDYTVPQGNNPSLKLQLDLIQNGVIVNTLNSPQLTSNGSYCFNLSTTISGINNNLGGFDYKVTGKPKIGTFTLAPKYIGNSVSGVDGNTNNDYLIKCPIFCDDCCKTKLDIWNAPGTPNPLTAVPKHLIGSVSTGGSTSYSMAEETFEIHNNAGVPITELRVNITDFEFEYNYNSCSSCKDNPALWASLLPGNATIGSGQNTLTVPTISMIGANINNHKNIREIVWENSNGAMLQSGNTFKIKYMLPALSGIPCCVTRVKVCINISWKDANCNTCNVNTCSVIELKSKK